MNILELLHNHRSIRNFLNKPIRKQEIEKILDAVIRTPSAGNMQTYSIILTKNKKLKKLLYKIHANQKMIIQAPMIVTFCCDLHRINLWLKQNNIKEEFNDFICFLIGTVDTILIAQSMALAAESLGLGICFLGTTLSNMHNIARVLKLPNHVVPISAFVMGYPNETPSKRDRLPLSGLLHFETYRNYKDEDIQNIYKEQNIKGLERYLSIPEIRKEIINSKIENLAQVYTKIKYPKRWRQKSSKYILSYLKNKNFL